MEWLTKGTEFHAWQDEEQGVALLWLYGNSDAGRTLIMSYVWSIPIVIPDLRRTGMLRLYSVPICCPSLDTQAE